MACSILAVSLVWFLGCSVMDRLGQKGENLKLHVLDVGQGTSQVVEFPGGKIMVVDGGGLSGSSFDVGQMVVAPFIRSLGYRKIDMLVLSHPEYDHAGGLKALIREFRVKKFLTNSDKKPYAVFWRDLMNECKRKGIARETITERRTVNINGAEVTFIPSDKCPDASSFNGRSLVVAISYLGKKIMLTGDIDKDRERCLLRSGVSEADILVVPHHGSKSSSSIEFIERLDPTLAIITSGWRNFLGLPNSEIVARYERNKITVLRTDQQGTITVSVGRKKSVYDTFEEEDEIIF